MSNLKQRKVTKIKKWDSCVVGLKNEDTEEKFRELQKKKGKRKIEIHIKKKNEPPHKMK